MQASGGAGPASAVDVADEPVPLQERFVLLQAIGRVGPGAGAGVRGVERPLAERRPGGLSSSPMRTGLS